MRCLVRRIIRWVFQQSQLLLTILSSPIQFGDGFLELPRRVLMAPQKPSPMILQISNPVRFTPEIKRNPFHSWINAIKPFELFFQSSFRQLHVFWV